MTAPLALIDTNVFISGVITSTQDAPTAVIVDAMISGKVPFVLSRDLLAEYRTVLLRPKIQKLHRLSGESVDAILGDVAENARIREVSPVSERERSGEDAHVLLLLEAAPHAVLVTGDRKLRANVPKIVRSLSPMEFVAFLV